MSRVPGAPLLSRGGPLLSRPSALLVSISLLGLHAPAAQAQSDKSRATASSRAKKAPAIERSAQRRSDARQAKEGRAGKPRQTERSASKRRTTDRGRPPA